MSAPQLGPSPAQITIMGHNISARIVAVKARRRRRVRMAIGAAALAIGLGVTAAGIRAATAPPAIQASMFSCYSVDDPRSDPTGIDAFDGIVHEGTDRVEAALEACSYIFGQDGVQTPGPTACELPDLRLGVFPNVEQVADDEFCASLGLGRPPLD